MRVKQMVPGVGVEMYMRREYMRVYAYNCVYTGQSMGTHAYVYVCWPVSMVVCMSVYMYNSTYVRGRIYTYIYV
jgi:hypothetical protein